MLIALYAELLFIRLVICDCKCRARKISEEEAGRKIRFGFSDMACELEPDAEHLGKDKNSER